MRRVIVLRPEPGASETIARARELGLDAIAVPLFEVEPVGWEAPDPQAFDALLLTSANAVRHGGANLGALRSLPVHAVGTGTADIARAAGFTVASIGNGGVDQLLGRVEPGLRLLHLCGADRRVPIPTGQKIIPLTVYRSTPIEPPTALGQASGSVILVHSPHAGRRLAELVDDRSSVAIAAISPAAAEAVGSGWAEVESAQQPTDDALLALALRLCNKPQA